MGLLRKICGEKEYDKVTTLVLPISKGKLRMRRPNIDDSKFITEQSNLLKDDEEFGLRFMVVVIKRLCEGFEKESDEEIFQDVKTMEIPDRRAVTQHFNKLMGVTKEEMNSIAIENFSRAQKTRTS